MQQLNNNYFASCSSDNTLKIWESSEPFQEAVSIKEDVAKKWLANGAQPTEVVAKLLKQAGIEK